MPTPTESNNLSFNSTDYLRKLMLTKNLPVQEALGPYGSYSPGRYAITDTRELSVVDQPNVDLVGEFFIDKSYLANAYGPPGGYDTWTQIFTASQGVAKVNFGLYPNFEAPETGAGLFGANPYMTVGQYYSPLQILTNQTRFSGDDSPVLNRMAVLLFYPSP